MSLFFGRPAEQRSTITFPAEQIPSRDRGTGGPVVVTTDSAKRHSAVWAALRLRADLVSTMPVDVFRDIDGIAVAQSTPLVLSLPGGERCDITEWLYSSQVDLDGAGNTFGIITKVDGFGLPARIELQDRATVTVRVRDGRLKDYRIANRYYDPVQVWHEKQFTQSGMHVGLSPIAYAAWSISEYLSAQQFAMRWFDGGAVPLGVLKNVERQIKPTEAAVVKDRFKVARADGLFVTGADWDYEMAQGDNATAAFMDLKQYGIADIGRFLGVPADLLDAAVQSGAKITYANITQKNLEFLVLNLGPSITRRERALSRIVPALRYVKLNTDALLRMDPATRATLFKTQIDSRTRVPSEARAKDNLPPFTADQMQEIEDLFGKPGATPPATDAQPAAAGAPDPDAITTGAAK